MNVRRLFRSRWMKIPLLLVGLLLLGGFGYLGWRLATTTPATYQPTETAAMGTGAFELRAGRYALEESVTRVTASSPDSNRTEAI